VIRIEHPAMLAQRHWFGNLPQMGLTIHGPATITASGPGSKC